MNGTCACCGAVGPVAYGQYRYTVGMLAGSYSKVSHGRFCKSCAKSRFACAMAITLLLGWWSIFGVLAAPICIIRNLQQKKRVDQEFEAPSTVDSPPAANLPQLPWANLMGIRQDIGVGQMPLTWPIAIGAVAGLCCFVSLIGFVGLSISPGNNSPQQAAMTRMIFAAGLVASLVIIFGCVKWHRRKHLRPGELPDLLSELFPGPIIFQQSCLQLAAVATRMGPNVRLMLAVENLSEGAAGLKCHLKSIGDVSPLESNLQPAEVAIYGLDIPLPAGRLVESLHFGMTCEVPTGAGQMTRHYPRAALRSQSSETTLAVAMAIGGHFSWRPSNRTCHAIAFMNNLGEFHLSLRTRPSTGTGEMPAMLNWKKIDLGAVADLSNLTNAARQVAQCLGTSRVQAAA